MHARRLLVTVVIFLVVGDANSAETDQHFSSGPRQVALVEVFTSEGCSSCPPADRWVSNLRSDSRLWQDFIPISFHVDYWDYIGWTDRFAVPENADRQRRHAEQGGARFVYTPGLFLNGQEWVGWRKNEAPIGDREDVGTLTVLVDDDNVALSFANEDRVGSALVAHVALLGMNLNTEVKAGENKGRNLRHDFVALGVVSTELKKTQAGLKAIMQLPRPTIRSEEQAIVAWISAAGTEAPLQAAGGYLN